MATGITLGTTSGEETMANGDLVRGTAIGTYPAAGGTATPSMNSRGDASVAMGLPERAEIVRLGGSWHYSIPTGSAFTTVAAWPTTRSELNLTNTNTTGNVCLVIDRIWAGALVTETAISAFSICCQISPAGLVATAAVADNTAVLCRNLNGKAGALTRAAGVAATIASTAYGIASQWDFPIQTQAIVGATVGVGQMSSAAINGGYIVQPGATFAVNLVVGTAVASAGLMGIVFHLAQLDLG